MAFRCILRGILSSGGEKDFWNVSTAFFVQSFDLSSRGTNPFGLFFKPDGTKMYVADVTIPYVDEYDLSSAWDISTISYVRSLSVGFEESTPLGLFFKPDGTKMYVIGPGSDAVNEYDLSTAWDVSTASYLQSFSVASEEPSPSEVFFKPDGTKMYVTGGNSQDVNEYDLSTAWDVSTASYLQSFSVASEGVPPVGLFFRSDGTKMYVSEQGNDSVNEYDLSTAWDVSTASYLQSFSVASEDTSPFSLSFKPEGDKMYFVGGANDSVNEYDIG